MRWHRRRHAARRSASFPSPTTAPSSGPAGHLLPRENGMHWHRRRHPARRSASLPSPTTAPSSGPAGHLLPREKGMHWHRRMHPGQMRRVFSFSHDCALIRPCGPPSPAGEGKELAPADSRGRRESTGTGGCTPARCGASFPSPTSAPSSGPAGHLLPREKGKNWHRRRHAARRSASFPSPTTAPSSGPAGHLLPREKGKNWHPRTPAGEGNALAPADAPGQTRPVFPFSRRMHPGQTQRVFPLSRRERGRGEGVRSARFHEKSTVAPGAHDLRRIRGAAGRGTVRARPANHVRVARSLPSA